MNGANDGGDVKLILPNVIELMLRYYKKNFIAFSLAPYILLCIIGWQVRSTLDAETHFVATTCKSSIGRSQAMVDFWSRTSNNLRRHERDERSAAASLNRVGRHDVARILVVIANDYESDAKNDDGFIAEQRTLFNQSCRSVGPTPDPIQTSQVAVYQPGVDF